jgi:ubiquinone/menaquinone biosynthesis C-methylase UbiE
MRSLSEHLGWYGIRHFENEEYWAWAEERLGPAAARELDYLRASAVSPGARRRPERLRRFYDRISEPHLAGIVHSMKAQAILKSGQAVAKIIAGRKNILDVGCGIGYLTTWYAASDASSRVTGLDFSPAAISEAARKARELGIPNVAFTVAEAGNGIPESRFGPPYDAVVDTQSVQMSAPLHETFAALLRGVAPGGILVSVPALETARHGKAFVNALKRAGFAIVSFEFIYYRDCGISGAYPVIVCSSTGGSSRGGRIAEPDIEAEFEKAWQNLRLKGKEMARE